MINRHSSSLIVPTHHFSWSELHMLILNLNSFVFLATVMLICCRALHHCPVAWSTFDHVFAVRQMASCLPLEHPPTEYFTVVLCLQNNPTSSGRHIMPAYQCLWGVSVGMLCLFLFFFVNYGAEQQSQTNPLWSHMILFQKSYDAVLWTSAVWQ